MRCYGTNLASARYGSAGALLRVLAVAVLELDSTVPAVDDDLPQPGLLCQHLGRPTASALVVWVLLGRVLPSALTTHPPLSEVVT